MTEAIATVNAVELIKSCPHDGGKSFVDLAKSGEAIWYSVLCSQCGARSAPAETVQEAILKWNMRY